MNDKWYNSDFASSLGMGICAFLLCCGVGTCCKLTSDFEKPTINLEKIEEVK